MKAPRRRQPTWRQPAALSAFVLVAWGWDTWLGHGGVSPWGWLAALVLVAGISALTVYSAKLHPLPADGLDPDDEVHVVPAPARGEPIEIRPATPDDLPLLDAIERSADTLFTVAGYGTFPDDAYRDDRSGAPLLLVVGTPPVAFIWVVVHDGEPHIEQLSVLPRSMKRGIGTALIEAACDWARREGYGSMTLMTFADVPWNGPYYEQHGFVEIPPDKFTPALQELYDEDVADGLLSMGRRIAMRKSLG